MLAASLDQRLALLLVDGEPEGDGPVLAERAAVARHRQRVVFSVHVPVGGDLGQSIAAAAFVTIWIEFARRVQGESKRDRFVQPGLKVLL